MLSENTISFLERLKENNDRTWFAENKQEFDMIWKNFNDFVQVMINEISLIDPSIQNVQVKECLFRIYRDIRFSKNKTPYKTHLAAYIASGGRKSIRAGYYFHIEPDNCMLAGGVYLPKLDVLRKIWNAIYERADELKAILNNEEFAQNFPELDDEKYKRVPSGFPKDFKDAELLKYKSYSVFKTLPYNFYFQDKEFKEFKELKKLIKILYPFNNFFNQAIDEIRI
ncbi:MAG: DUF2461 domain-containing protein [Ignavibacteria bacterium]|jgi:uncharacterized protein (TIGR02453 family)|nr:DUF2461 domain-containing protein [Ignavibacteria bacterium]